MTDDVPIKVVGWGPFRLPGERKRRRKAEKEARRMLELADNAARRSEEAERANAEDEL